MEPLATPSRSDSDPIGAPTPRPHDEAAYQPYSAVPPVESGAQSRERTWNGNRPLARVEPVSGAIVGGIALVVLGFLVLVAPVVLRWVVGIAFIGMGVGAFLWANSHAAHRDRPAADARVESVRY